MFNETIFNSHNSSDGLLESRAIFTWYDYVLFVSVCAASAGIGIYFGCFGSKQASKEEYIFGNKQVNVIPTILSLIAGQLSGVTVIGGPTDTYFYGAYFFLLTIGKIVEGILLSYLFLPIFYKLQFASIYEYLEARFDSRTRKLASVLFTLKIVCVQPVAFVLGSLTLSTASGLSFDFIAPIFFGLCIFYTAIGGIKAVIWTDALQFLITYGALMIVLILSMKDHGIDWAWNKARNGERLDIFDFDMSLTKRDTFWSFLFGHCLNYVAYSCVSQSFIQKCLSVSTLHKSQLSAIWFAIGSALIIIMGVFIGIMMYARYETCDPYTSKKINKPDEIIAYFVADISRGVPGLSGLFVAGIYCTVLSTLSSNLNSLACTIYEDFLKNLFEKKGFRRITLILRLTVISIGFAMLFLVYAISKFQAIYVLSWSIVGVCVGPVLGLYLLGFFVPQVNSKGAFFGCMIGFVFAGIIACGTAYNKFQNLLVYPTKSLSIEECVSFNYTNIAKLNPTKSDIFVLFKISHAWMSLIGAIVTIIFTLIISYICREKSKPVSRELLSPFIHRFLPKEKFDSVIYCDVST